MGRGALRWPATCSAPCNATAPAGHHRHPGRRGTQRRRPADRRTRRKIQRFLTQPMFVAKPSRAGPASTSSWPTASRASSRFLMQARRPAGAGLHTWSALSRTRWRGQGTEGGNSDGYDSPDFVAQDRNVFSGDVTEVQAPGSEGQLGILPKHAPLMTVLSPGEVIVHRAGAEPLYFAVSGGWMEVRPDHITILARTAERSDEINEERAEAARGRATAGAGMRRDQRAGRDEPETPDCPPARIRPAPRLVWACGFGDGYADEDRVMTKQVKRTSERVTSKSETRLVGERAAKGCALFFFRLARSLPLLALVSPSSGSMGRSSAPRGRWDEHKALRYASNDR